MGTLRRRSGSYFRIVLALIAPALALTLASSAQTKPSAPKKPSAQTNPTRAAEPPAEAVRTVSVTSGELTLHGLLWRPAGKGPFPAVLFNHGSGPAADAQQAGVLGTTFARHGYMFLYLYRRGAGLSSDQGTNSEELMNRAMEAKGQAGRNEVQLQLLDAELPDAVGGLAFLRSDPEVDKQRLVVAGHSFGGSLSLLLAERETDLRAVVVFAAAGKSWEASPPLRTRLLAAVDHSNAPVLFVYAANDYSIAPARELAAEMTRRHKLSQSRIYPAFGTTASQGHSFVYSGLSTWEQDVFAFLDDPTR